MSQTYTIHKDIINNIFKKLIDSKQFNHKTNAESAINIILSHLDETYIEAVTTLMLREEEYEVLSIGDYVEVEPPKYHPGSNFEEDVLADMGLIKKDGKPAVYAQVVDDTSWSSSSNKLFNPFYSAIKVNLLYHCEDRKLKYQEYDINPLYVKKVNKKDIAYFNKVKKKEVEPKLPITL
jgi:hypothetical protein